MERVTGINVRELKRVYPEGMVPFATAMKIGYELIRIIQVLHEESHVVHGSISLDNVFLKQSSSSSHNVTWSVTLKNFGRSFENIPRQNEPIREEDWDHYAYSIWEWAGYLSAPRDDIARAVFAIAELIQPWDFFREAYFFLLEPTNYFAVDWVEQSDGTLVNPVDALNITQEYKTLIHDGFGEVSNLVGNMTDINAVPPYEQILYCLTAVRNLYIVAQSVAATLAPSE